MDWINSWLWRIFQSKINNKVKTLSNCKQNSRRALKVYLKIFGIWFTETNGATSHQKILKTACLTWNMKFEVINRFCLTTFCRKIEFPLWKLNIWYVCHHEADPSSLDNIPYFLPEEYVAEEKTEMCVALPTLQCTGRRGRKYAALNNKEI